VEEPRSFDVFISHASEDKAKLVRRLAELLHEEQLSVWYDEHSLLPGDSLRKSIDMGLSRSRFGIVILSPAFFGKKWPEWELNGLVQLQNSSDNRRIIPIWHNIDYEDVVRYSPSLADIVAIKSELGLRFVVEQIIKVVRPRATSLGIAREKLRKLGYSPPPVTDEWWLDVIEYDGSDSNVYDWSFHVGWLPKDPIGRGELIAKKVIQRKWQEVVVEENISQTTRPEHLFAAIDSVPGSFELLLESLSYTICYAPQLTIKGFGGPFEAHIEELYQHDVRKRVKTATTRSGTALTINGRSPSCDEEFALRDPNFGYYKPAHVTCQFVQGALMGSSSNVYDHFEYLVWLLSEDSNWLPRIIKNYLLKGFLDWNVWSWHDMPRRRTDDMHRSDVTGSLMAAMFEAADKDIDFQLTEVCLSDITERIGWSLAILEIDDDIEAIKKRLIEGRYIESCVTQYRGRRASIG